MIPLEIHIDFSEAAERIYQEERSGFVDTLAEQITSFADANKDLTLVEVAIRFQHELTRALVEVMQTDDLASMIAGRMIDEVPEIALLAVARLQAA